LCLYSLCHSLPLLPLSSPEGTSLFPNGGEFVTAGMLAAQLARRVYGRKYDPAKAEKFPPFPGSVRSCFSCLSHTHNTHTTYNTSTPQE
jgi:hypothetical protein